MRNLRYLLIVAALLALAIPAEARTIVSVNFYNNSSGQLLATESAGYIPATNWNNAASGTTTINGLVNNSGATTGVNLTYWGSGPNSDELINAMPSSDTTMMMQGTRSITNFTPYNQFAQFQFSNLTAALGTYDVYVYYGTGYSGGSFMGGKGEMLLNSGEYYNPTGIQFDWTPSATYVGGSAVKKAAYDAMYGAATRIGYETYNSQNTTPNTSGVPVWSGTFVQATSTSTVGNFVKFSGVSLDSMVITPGTYWYPQNATGLNGAFGTTNILGIEIVGAPAAHLTATPPTDSNLNFGSVTGDSTILAGVTITNDGDVDAPAAHLTGATFSGDYASHFSLGNGDPNATLNVGDTQTFDIHFTRDGLPSGNYATDLTFTSDIGQTFTYHVSADITSLSAHLASYPDAGSTISFGDVVDTATLYGAVVLLNDAPGGDPANLQGAMFSGPYASRFSLVYGNPYASIASGNAEFFDVFFDAQGLLGGIYTTDLTIASDVPGQESFVYHFTANVQGSEGGGPGPGPEPVAEPAGLALLGLTLLGLRKRRS